MGDICPGRGQAAHHGPDRHLHRLSNFAVRQAFNTGECQCRFLSQGKTFRQLQDLVGQYVHFDLPAAIDTQSAIRIDKTLSHSDPARTDLIEPDRVQDGEQPAIEPCPHLKLVGTFERANNGRLDEIVGNITLTRQQYAETPKARQVGFESSPHRAFAWRNSIRAAVTLV